MENAPVQISRDPFARYDIVRKLERDAGSGCHWCGQHRKGGNLFVYGMWPDGSHIRWQDKQFCSLGCMKAFTC